MLEFKQQSKILEGLLSDPANCTCADCPSLSPRWASLDFGVFICSSCAGGHRALGPTITRVKSVHLDGWQRVWVENMVIGNEKLNAFWQGLAGAKDRKPQFGAELSEYDRFVNDKYKKKRFVSDHTIKDPLTRLKSGIPLAANPVRVETRVQTKVETGVQNVKPVSVVAEKKKQIEKTVVSQPKTVAKTECVDLMDFSDPVVVNKQEVNKQEFSDFTSGDQRTPEAQNFISFDRLLLESTKPIPVVQHAFHGHFSHGVHHNYNGHHNAHHIPQHQLSWGMQTGMMPNSY